jgi:lauroyl/myristoyl acyltransferase
MTKDLHPRQHTQPTLLQRFLGSRLVTGVGMSISKYLPPTAGYAIGGLIAGLINWLKPDVYWIVHANLRQVVGPQVDEKTVHRLVRQVFRNTTRNNYEVWHLVGRGLEALRAVIHVPPDVWERIDQVRRRGKGVIIAGAHTGNFDVGLLALATQKWETQVLGLAIRPAGGFDLMDHMRTRTGVHLTPISVPALREAIKRLRAGGVVLTGVDRPVGDEEQWVEFFGRPAPLPTGHVRLALKTDAVIFVASAYRDSQRSNVVRLSAPLEMVRTGDPDEDLRVNMRRVTAWLEEFIRARPEQWAMFVPVWPERQEVTQAHGQPWPTPQG